MCPTPYQSPPVIVSDENIYSVVFVAPALAANSQQTYVSSSLPYPVKVLEATVYFPDDAINNVRVYWLNSSNNQGSTTTIPDGTNLLSPYTSTGFLIGHAIQVSIPCYLEITNEKPFIKMHVVNNNAYATTLMGVIKFRKVV